jgi:hypothetical protein
MKPKLIICTTGTSIGTNLRRDIFTPDQVGSADPAREIRHAILNKDVDSISAEIKSFKKISRNTTQDTGWRR